MPVKILNLDLTNQISELFRAQLVEPVALLYFYDNETCDTCEETGQLLEEITALSDKLQLQELNISAHQALIDKYNITLTPGLVVAGGSPQDPIDYGIRFAGIPSGYEFGSLIQAILMVSRQDSGLRPGMRLQLKDLEKPVHLRVFVTPT